MSERPLRVWKYRGWCWICRVCALTVTAETLGQGVGLDYNSQPEALADALHHLDVVHPRGGKVISGIVLDRTGDPLHDLLRSYRRGPFSPTF